MSTTTELSTTLMVKPMVIHEAAPPATTTNDDVVVPIHDHHHTTGSSTTMVALPPPPSEAKTGTVAAKKKKDECCTVREFCCSTLPTLAFSYIGFGGMQLTLYYHTQTGMSNIEGFYGLWMSLFYISVPWAYACGDLNSYIGDWRMVPANFDRDPCKILPRDVFVHALTFLGIHDALKIENVCKAWARSYESDRYWRFLWQRDFGTAGGANKELERTMTVNDVDSNSGAIIAVQAQLADRSSGDTRVAVAALAVPVHITTTTTAAVATIHYHDSSDEHKKEVHAIKPRASSTNAVSPAPVATMAIVPSSSSPAAASVAAAAGRSSMGAKGAYKVSYQLKHRRAGAANDAVVTNDDDCCWPWGKDHKEGGLLAIITAVIYWLITVSFAAIHPLIPGLVRKYEFGGYMIGNDTTAARTLFSFNIIWPGTLFILMTFPVWIRVSGFVQLWTHTLQRLKILAKDTVQLLTACTALLSDARLAAAVSDPERAAASLTSIRAKVMAASATTNGDGVASTVAADSFSPSFWLLLARRTRWNLAETVHLYRRQLHPVIYLSRCYLFYATVFGLMLLIFSATRARIGDDYSGLALVIQMGTICGWFFIIGIILAIYQVMLGRRYTWIRRGLLRMLDEKVTAMPTAQRDGLQLKTELDDCLTIRPWRDLSGCYIAPSLVMALLLLTTCVVLSIIILKADWRL